ncbi:MAG: phosphate ABC transporter ATP-binding protein PstB [Nitrososphaerales archaeon]
MSTIPAIDVQDLNIYYDKFQAIKSVSLKIPPNQVSAIIGPSGCGKSTLLRSFNRMNDLIPNARTEGKVLLNGESIYDGDADVTDIRRRIGMVFQKPNPFPKSVFDNVAFGPRINGSKRNLGEVVEQALKQAALWEEVKGILKKNALELSGGQQQRLCIARALAVEPEILLMDEPCSSLDPIATSRIEELIRSLKANYTIVIVTHNMQQAARVSDLTSVMMVGDSREGYLAEHGSTKRIFTNPRDSRTEDYIRGKIG